MQPEVRFNEKAIKIIKLTLLILIKDFNNRIFHMYLHMKFHRKIITSNLV